MKISKDRINWKVPLGNDYPECIFAMNSDIIQTTETATSINQSNYKKSVNQQYFQSRVVNVSGQLIAKNIYDCRRQETELKNNLIGDKLYFYDDYKEKTLNGVPVANSGKVLVGFVPNINDSIGRGVFDGKTSLINFNITCLSPFYEEYSKTESTFTMNNTTSISVDNSLTDEITYDTPYSIEITFSTSKSVSKIFTDLLEFETPVSVVSGDVLTFSSENENFEAKKNTSSILGNIKDNYYINGYLLKSGENSFTIPTELQTGCTIKISYYKRTL